jgi:RHS repeat-associated protein
LWRNGELDATNFALEIDDLTYTYAPESNLLLKVTDATSSPAGFQDDATDGNLASDTTNDYAYDVMGNMIVDENKDIRRIIYNHLNLPVLIYFGERGTITYLYDATGRKVRKVVQNDVLSQNTVTDYANGFQYENNIIQFFPTAEGYVSRLTTKIEESGRVVKIPIEELPEDQFTYVYNYTDHLGNIRLSYAQDPDTQQLKIVEQNHYYPFGLRHTNYSGGKMQVVKEQELKRMAPTPEELLSYKYKYNGKEWQDELGLNMYDYGFRKYDPAVGRWMNIDPLAEMGRRLSPYNYALNNPVRFIDPDGMWSYDTNGNATTSDTDEIAAFMSQFQSQQDGDKDSTPKQEQYKNGDYVAVVNSPNGAGGFGHNALLVGNNDTGWIFISKEGRDEDESSNSGNNPISGGPALDPRTKKFATIEEFLKDKDFSEYKEGIVMKIKSSTAKEGQKKMTKEALSKYSILFNNCGHAVEKTLIKLGIRTIDPDKYSNGQYSAGAALYSGIVPNELYNSVKEANKNEPRTILIRE